MCRSIQTLRPPFVEAATDEQVRAAALQYVRKISGFRAPSRANAQVFEAAVDAVAEATAQLLAALEVRPVSVRAVEAGGMGARSGASRPRQVLAHPDEFSSVGE